MWCMRTGDPVRRRTAWLAAVSLSAVLLAVVVAPWSGWAPDPGHRGSWLSQLAGAAVFGYVGAAIADRTTGSTARIGLLLQVTGLTQAATLLTSSYLHRAALEGWSGTVAVGWLDGWLWAPGVLAAVTILPLVYPDGEPLPGLAPVLRAALGVSLAGPALVAWAAWPGRTSSWVGPVVVAAAGACAVVGVGALLVRHRRGDPETREQVRWLLGSVLALVVFQPVAAALPGPAATVGLSVLPLLVPVSVGLAVLRHGLYDIDLAVTRALTYAVLCTVLVGVYVAVVVLAGRRLAGPSFETPAVVAALAVALLANPVRAWLQARLSRWLRGASADPHRLVADLTARLGSSPSVRDAPQVVVDTLASVLRAGFVELATRDEEGTLPVARAGADTGGHLVRTSVVYGGRSVGEIVTGRVEPLAEHEHRALRQVAAAVGPVLDGWLLTHQLQRSRTAVVEAREAERTRLHRDLHDGVGPTLGGIALGLEAARNHLHRDPAEAERVLQRLAELAGQATGEVRGLVEALRPAALDGQGLEGLIRCHAEAVEPALAVTVDPAVPGALSPAVEVAVLRIVLEALTNVRRHAAASGGQIQLSLDEDRVLSVVVDDDGRGIVAGRPAGVGLGSIRARAAELGGVATVGRSPLGGTRVLARIPVDGAAGAR